LCPVFVKYDFAQTDEGKPNAAVTGTCLTVVMIFLNFESNK